MAIIFGRQFYNKSQQRKRENFGIVDVIYLFNLIYLIYLLNLIKN